MGWKYFLPILANGTGISARNCVMNAKKEKIRNEVEDDLLFAAKMYNRGEIGNEEYAKLVEDYANGRRTSCGTVFSNTVKKAILEGKLPW